MHLPVSSNHLVYSVHARKTFDSLSLTGLFTTFVYVQLRPMKFDPHDQGTAPRVDCVPVARFIQVFSHGIERSIQLCDAQCCPWSRGSYIIGHHCRFCSYLSSNHHMHSLPARGTFSFSPVLSIHNIHVCTCAPVLSRRCSVPASPNPHASPATTTTTTSTVSDSGVEVKLQDGKLFYDKKV